MIAVQGSAIGRRLRHFFKREAGTATIEFCFVVPMAMMIFMASMEAGLYMIRHVMLERGLDLTMRDFRLGRMATFDHNQIRHAVCERSPMITDCETRLKVWMEPINTTTWRMPNQEIYCGDRNDALVSPLPGSTSTGLSGDLMLIRVCTLEKPIFPSTGFSLRLRADSATGAYELATATVVVNEPR